MTTLPEQSNQLSNNTIQVFKPESTNTISLFKPLSNGLFNCQLTLTDGKSMNIPMREDGYVNATLLCQAGGKRIDNWTRLKSTKELMVELSRSLENEGSKSIDSIKGGNRLYQGTYFHPDLAIQLAQWISPLFAVQVSRWIRQLLITGKVELGKEKSNEALELEYKKKIEHLQKALDFVAEDNQKVKNNYLHLQKVHDSILLKRNYYKFKKGNCVYIVTDKWREKNYLKIGFTDNINHRLRTYRTSMPDCKIEFLVYLQKNELLENCLKTKFFGKLVQKNHEYIIDIELEKLVKSTKALIKFLNLDVMYDETLALYNNPYEYEPVEIIFVENEDKKGEIKEINEEEDIIVESSSQEETIEEEDKDVKEKESYRCDECGKEYKLQGFLKNHLEKVHNKIDEYHPSDTKCHICNKELSNKGKLNRHINSVHKKITKVKCKTCKKVFTTRDIMIAHVKNVHKKLSKTECKECGKVCTTAGNLKRHISQVHEKSDNIVDCSICHKKMNKANLTQHILKVHKRKEKTGCTVCGKVLLSKLGMEYHLQHSHRV